MVRSVIMMGMWSDDRSVSVVHVIDGAMLHEQKVISGEVGLKPA